MTDFYFNDIKLLDIELSNNCNAACPMCARNIHGYSINPRLQLNELSIDDFLNINFDILDNIEFINISGNYGDPLMCHDVVNIIHYLCETTPAKICMHTNGGLRNAEIWKQLGKIDQLEVRFGIDGLEDTNHLHRINVCWDLLMNNIKTYINAGGDATWVFLVFFHNQHQIDEARHLAKELKFNKFKTVISDRWRADNFPVFNKEGETSHNLFPGATNIKDYKQFEHRQNSSLDVNKAKNKNGYGYIRQRFDTYVEHNWRDFISDNEQPKLHCYANNDNRIYIDANGYVFPCNSLGYIYGWANRYDYFASQILELLNSYSKEETNIKFNTLKNILNSNWFKCIHNTWQSNTISEGRLMMCSHTCGKQSAHKMVKDHIL
jgi:MoaA/NifB/PqqE/SkfB family radical SAM enzyme|tara:strand:- start:62 stop:1195 length:1134 start_codon:yes stop_codon:yes gene_type:complete